MNTKFIREYYDLTQLEFSVLFEIPYSTVRNWDARDCMPLYIHKLIVRIIDLRYRTFVDDSFLFQDMSTEQIKEDFIKMLKDEAKKAIRFENEKAL